MLKINLIFIFVMVNDIFDCEDIGAVLSRSEIKQFIRLGEISVFLSLNLNI